ncbi:uncharacterized protein [Halyomorpha halys]|uniref:uncharacterized protein n=1 Tax=Halyomorpha halys TaxID=286706 RepID=UPI0006D518F3|nr:uncharacterized protein LOC106679747 [Halyomorpha halys]
MAEGLAVALLITILFVYSVNSDVLVPEAHRSKSLIETCTSDCLKKVNVESNDIGNSDSCSRGCRLFMIASLISDKQDTDQNASRNSCKDMCQESYGINNVDVLSCKVGCDLSVVQNVQVPVVAEVSWSLFIDNGNSLQILQGEIPETDDVLTDPGLRSQVSRLESMRLPQVSLRTLPVQTGVEEIGPCGGLRGTNLPYSYCLVWSLLLLLLLFVLWSCLSLADLPLQSVPSQEKLPLA